MEGGIFSHSLVPPPPPPPPPLPPHDHLRPTPPFSAIDRFLWGQNNKNIQVSQDGVSEFLSNSCSHGVGFPIFNGNGGGVVWQSLSNYGDGMLVDQSENTQKFGTDLNMGMKQKEEKSVPKRKRVKGGYPLDLIKGQWTDEEDRKLLRLVKQYGVKKWAQIAEKMFGRAGKQCRERWHNHLRPDIKKDTWTEEEERMLVEAHQQLGNKWADIAKQIPGRSENSIKNHWNATKRRQNSRRKCKKIKAKNVKPQSSPLQDYIRTKILKETTTNVNCTSIATTSTQSTTSSNATSTNSTVSQDPSIKLVDVLFPQSPCEDSTSLIIPTYDDELKFMQGLFASTNYSNAPLLDDTPKTKNMLHENIVTKEVVPDQMLQQPDHYLANLLDGATHFPPSYQGSSMVFDQQIFQESSSGTKEMDLIEMVSAFQFDHGSNKTIFLM